MSPKARMFPLNRVRSRVAVAAVSIAIVIAMASVVAISQTERPAETVASAAKPSTTLQWVDCAPQEGHCNFEGTKRVRFGVDTRWVEREFTGSAHCNSRTFGSNPAQGALKTCQIQQEFVAPPPPPAPLPKGDGTAALRWTAPTHATDGQPLGNKILGYRIRYGLSPDALTEMIQVPGGKVTSYIVRDLGKGVWHFSVVAYVADGYESDSSNIATKTIE